MIVARFDSRFLAFRYLNFRGRGEVVELPCERWPSHPWAVTDG